MLFHVSIEADDPARVARVLAELWQGEALPFPPVAQGSWMAFAGQDDGTMIEVYPRGTCMVEGEGDAIGLAMEPRRGGATHVAIGTALSADQVYAIAAREGWTAKYCKRGGKFGVIELWVEGCSLVEVLTADMQREYRDSVTIAGWKALLAAPAPERIAA